MALARPSAALEDLAEIASDCRRSFGPHDEELIEKETLLREREYMSAYCRAVRFFPTRFRRWKRCQRALLPCYEEWGLTKSFEISVRHRDKRETVRGFQADASTTILDILYWAAEQWGYRWWQLRVRRESDGMCLSPFPRFLTVVDFQLHQGHMLELEHTEYISHRVLPIEYPREGICMCFRIRSAR